MALGFGGKCERVQWLRLKRLPKCSKKRNHMEAQKAKTERKTVKPPG